MSIPGRDTYYPFASRHQLRAASFLKRTASVIIWNPASFHKRVASSVVRKPVSYTLLISVYLYLFKCLNKIEISSPRRRPPATFKRIAMPLPVMTARCPYRNSCRFHSCFNSIVTNPLPTAMRSPVRAVSFLSASNSPRRLTTSIWRRPFQTLFGPLSARHRTPRLPASCIPKS